MDHSTYVVDPMISAKSIAARVESLAREIAVHFGDTEKLIIVGLLRGSVVFIADLVREIDLPVEVDFLETSSYGDGMESSKEVRILKDLRGEIEGREVDIKATWIGFDIPDEFVVGYGIDYGQRNRNLDHIGKVRFL